MAREREPAEENPEVEELHKQTDVHEMFSRTVKTYDLLNHVFSFNIDRLWRNKLIALANPPEDGRLLDLCCGTADVAIAFARKYPGCRIVGADFVEEMLVRGREKVAQRALSDRIELVQADAMSLPFEDDSFHALTVAFGLRNLPDHLAGIREMVRVVRPGGTVLILEFAPPPDTLFGRSYRWYLRNIMPPVGAKISGYWPTYGYLYSSVSNFLTPGALADDMRGSGLEDVTVKKLSGGIAYIHAGRKRER